MAKVFIIGMFLVILIGCGMFALIGLSGASRIGEAIQNMGRKKKRTKKKEKNTDEQ